MKKKFNFWAAVKVVLLSDKFKTLLQTLILKLLSLQMSGGIRGWLIKTLVGKFSDEVIEVITDTGDYLEIRKKAADTATMENRDEATDLLNDLMR